MLVMVAQRGHFERVEDGALVRLSRPLTDDERGWVTLPHRGERITIDEFFTAGNPDDDEIPVDFYEAHDEHGCTVVIPADAVEVVKTATEMRARRVPTVTEVRDEVASKLCGYLGYDGMEINETVRCRDDARNDNEIEAYGVTADGLPFGVRLRVLSTWETDL